MDCENAKGAPLRSGGGPGGQPKSLVVKEKFKRGLMPRAKKLTHVSSLDKNFLEELVARGLLANLPEAEAKELSLADDKAVKSGEGFIYGELTVLGTSEMRRGTTSSIQDDYFRPPGEETWMFVGLNSEKFVLKRRSIPNGRHILSSNTSQCNIKPDSIEKLDFSTDIYQIGRRAPPLVRATNSVYNDIVLKGPLSVDGAAIMPRYACRIMIDRTPPFTVRVYSMAADGRSGISRLLCDIDETMQIDREQEHNVDRYAHPQLRGILHNSSDRWDKRGFPGGRAAVRLWRPDSKVWMDVSATGDTFEASSSIDLRSSHGVNNLKDTRRLMANPNDPENPYTNQLVDGSILDISGVFLCFQSPASMATRYTQTPDELMDLLNRRNPTCPVLYSSLTFSYSAPRERALREYVRLKKEHASRYPSSRCRSMQHIPFTVPHTDHLHSDELNECTMVFPACGHVFGYHQALKGRCCPMCRTEGPFHPLAFAFEPALNGYVLFPEDEVPTHVFNPCGHAASLSTCRRWSTTYFMTDSLHCHPAAHLLGAAGPSSQGGLGTHTICPFCSSILDPRKAYSRLIVHTDCVKEGNSDRDDDEAGNDPVSFSSEVGTQKIGETSLGGLSHLLQSRHTVYPKVCLEAIFPMGGGKG